MEDSIKHAVNGEFSKFEQAVTDRLKTKIANDPDISKRLSDYDHISKMKSAFAKITNPEE